MTTLAFQNRIHFIRVISLILINFVNLLLSVDRVDDPVKFPWVCHCHLTVGHTNQRILLWRTGIKSESFLSSSFVIVCFFRSLLNHLNLLTLNQLLLQMKLIVYTTLQSLHLFEEMNEENRHCDPCSPSVQDWFRPNGSAQVSYGAQIFVASVASEHR